MAYKKANDTSISQTQQYLSLKQINIFTFIMLAALFFFSNIAQAQNQNFASLNLTNSYDENFLSPYIRQYEKSFNENNISSIVTAHHRGSDIKQNLKSLIYFGFKGDEKWLSFEVNNRSSKQEWYIDFGDYFSGRFGLLKEVDVYVLDMVGSVVSMPTKGAEQKNSVLQIDLPVEQKSMVILRVHSYAGLPTTLPLKVISQSNKESITKKRLVTNIIILFGLVGMMFFFIAFAIAKRQIPYSYFSVYYALIATFLLLHTQIISSVPLIGGIVIPLFLSLLAIIGLFLAKIFWDEDIYSEALNKILKISFIATLAAPLIGLFIPTPLAIVKIGLYFGPSLLLLLLIPIITLVKSSEGRNEAMPFIFGWFILLFGLSISAFSVSGLMPPLSAMLNAFWYALIPQVLFFTYALAIKGGAFNTGLPTSRTVEIEENESVSRVRQSKEQAEQDRLMKVIEQERRVLTELRKSEARRAEEMRLAKEEADLANRGKSAFLAVVTHEIRTPMTGIMGMVKMLLESGLDKKQKDYALTIQESSDAMLALLNDILDFEKIEQGKMQIEAISFDLPRLINGVVTLMNGHATQKNIELIASVDSSLPQFVKGDPTRLRQILLNLTGNAIKFTSKGNVTVKAQMIKKSADNQSCEVYLGVTDSGVGISKEGQQKIFDAFSQADDTVSRKFGGTGLGLAISKGLVEAMGSNININSNEGEGSTFFFTLNMPVAKNKEADTASIANRLNKKDDIKPLKILVVDDNKINRKVMIGFLENSPHRIDTAENAKEALEKLEKDTYDLVFMDIEMPGMNGDEATVEIRHNSNPQIANTPVVALTGNVNDEQISSYLKSGMSGFLAKPIDPEKLSTITIQAAAGSLRAPKPEIEKNDTEIIPSKEVPIAPDTQIIETKKPINEENPESKKPTISVSRTSSVSRTASVKRTSPPMTEQKQETPLSEVVVEETDKITIGEKPLAPAPPKNTGDYFDEDMLNTLRGHLDIGAIKSMLDEVFEKSDEIFIALKAANENKNAIELHAKAHELKGMTGNFGLKEISVLSATIEEHAKSEKFDDVGTHIDKIPTALTNAKAAVENWLNN